MPPMVLTSKSAQIFKPTPTGSPRFILPQIEIVIGKHQARGKRNKPCTMHPKIKKILLATAKPSLPPFTCVLLEDTAQPQPGQITVSSKISLPHFWQNFIKPLRFIYFVVIRHNYYTQFLSICQYSNYEYARIYERKYRWEHL